MQKSVKATILVGSLVCCFACGGSDNSWSPGGGGGGGGSSGSGTGGGYDPDEGVDIPVVGCPDPNCHPLYQGQCTPHSINGPGLASCGCCPNESCEIATLEGAAACVPSKFGQLSSRCFATEPGECVPGAMCAIGGCKQFCNEDYDCPGDGSICFKVAYSDGGGSTVNIPQAKVCTDHCAPWDPYSCQGGLGCMNASDLQQRPGTFACTPVGTSISKCNDPYACGPGYACFGETLPGDCYKWCRRSNNGDCPSGKTCVEIGGLFWGYDEIGVCY